MLNIAICDDQNTSVAALTEKVSNYCDEHNTKYEIFTYKSGEELIASETDKLSIIFLDVDMGALNGIDTAKEIRKTNKDVIIIYVSGYVQYAPAGYQVKAFAYILKNDIDALFNNVMDEVFKELNFKEDIYKIKIDSKDISPPLKDIVFIESFDKTVDIHHISGEKYTIKAQINDIYNELKSKGFLQIHKSYIVNMQHVIKAKNYVVALSNGRELMASQRRWKDIMAEYLEWKGRM